MKNLTFFFDGIRQNTDDIDGSNASSFTFRKATDSGDSAFSFSPDLQLYGDSYDYVRTKIINSPIPALVQIDVLIYDECCADDNGNPLLLFIGKIEGSDVEWCELPCESCTVAIVDNSNDALAVACLKNTQIWDRKEKFDGSGISDGEDSFRPANFTSYCVDIRPGFLQEIIFIFGFLFIVAITPALFALATIVTVINVIIAAINLIGGNITPIGGDISFYDDALAIINILSEIIVGCGFKHKTPFLHSYMSNLCDICGINLQSSLFGIGGYYHDTMRLDAQFYPGRKLQSKILRNWEKNKPNLNGKQFLDQLKQFNIIWRVVGGSLVIEREDYEFGGIWFDLANIDADSIESLCFNVSDEKPPAYGEYLYSKDGVDNTGDEVVTGWCDLVFDWNVPVNPMQSGLKQTNLFFGAAQFRADSNRDDVSALDKTFYNAVFPVLNDYQGAMLMEKGICNFPKLLIWDGSSPQDDARVLRYPSIVSDTFDYNVNWWVKETYQDDAGNVRDTAYQTLFSIDDPRTTGIKRRKYTLILTATCTLVREMSVDKTIKIPVGGIYYDATVDEIQYDTNNFKFTISGKV